MKTSKLFKFIKKKQKGQGDLIASLFVVLALTLFVFFFINVIADVNTRIQMDQIARKYILRMETEGYLTAEEKTAIKDELMSIPSVAAVTDGADISFAGSTESSVGYGATIILKISCPAATTAYVAPSSHEEGGVEVADTSTVGGIQRDETTKKVYIITKSSTAKY